MSSVDLPAGFVRLDVERPPHPVGCVCEHFGVVKPVLFVLEEAAVIAVVGPFAAVLEPQEAFRRP